MAGKRKSPLWRKVFLRALARTGNARASAVEAGVDVGTAYDHRIKDPGFAKQWAAALARFKAIAARKPRPLHHRASRGGPPPRSGEELVLRRTKHGDKLVRAAPGRWCARVEESFFDGLELTGCVRTAAAAAGFRPMRSMRGAKIIPNSPSAGTRSWRGPGSNWPGCCRARRWRALGRRAAPAAVGNGAGGRACPRSMSTRRSGSG